MCRLLLSLAALLLLSEPTALAAHPIERGVAAMAGSQLDYAISKLHDSPAVGGGPPPRGILGIELLRIRRRVGMGLTADGSLHQKNVHY